MSLRVCAVAMLLILTLTGCPGLLNNLAVLGVDPIVLEFDGRTKDLKKDLFISNKGAGTLNWQVIIPADDTKWITATPENGVGNATVSIQVFPKVQTKPTEAQISVKNINGNNEVAVKIKLTFGETAAEGQAPEGATPVEGEVLPEGETPVEGEVLPEGETPVEGEVLPEGAALEGQPVEGQTLEGQPLEGETPVEGQVPVEGQAPEGQVETVTPYGLWLEGDPLSAQQAYAYFWRAQAGTDLFIYGLRGDMSLSTVKAISPYVLVGWGGPFAVSTTYYPYLMDLECLESVVETDAFSQWVDQQTANMTYDEYYAFFDAYSIYFGAFITDKASLLSVMRQGFLVQMDGLWPANTVRLGLWDRPQETSLMLAFGYYDTGIRPANLSDPSADRIFTGSLVTGGLKSVTSDDDPDFFAQVEQLAAQFEASLTAGGQ